MTLALATTDESIACACCPKCLCPDRIAYKEHCDCAWHKFNLNQRLFGNQVLTEEEYLEKEGGGQAAKGGTGANAQDDAKKDQDDKKQNDTPEGMINVCVAFQYEQEKWSHKFLIQKGSTIVDLKRKLVKPESPEEDLLAFSLKRGMLRVTAFETLDQDETFDFQYIGPEEGQRLLDRDTQRREREEADLREREEAQQRQQEEAKQRAEEAERKRKEEEQKEEEKKRREELGQKEEEQEKRLREEREKAAAEERQRQEAQRREASQREAADKARLVAEKAKQEAEQAARARASQAQAQPQPNQITVYIDRELDMKTKVTVQPGATSLMVKEQLMRNILAGEGTLKDFALVDPVFEQELADSDVVAGAFNELDVCRVGC